jgi:squalene synthase HpnC
MQNQKDIEKAYQYCQDLARQHYENFPTATRLLDAQQRKATAAIYAFARQADDIVDEGDHSAQTRLQLLDQYLLSLENIYNGIAVDDPVFIALSDTIRQFDLPQQAFRDLLYAFRMDVTQQRYTTFQELLHYCRHSANPIGQLILRLHRSYSAENGRLSDHICTALQLINFIQDIDEDFQQRQRIYIPQDEMATFAISEDMLANRVSNERLEKLVQTQLERAQNFLLSGSGLVDALRGRLKLIMMLTINSGLEICSKLQSRQNCYVRPVLHKADWIKIVLRTMYFRSYIARAKLRATAQ